MLPAYFFLFVWSCYSFCLSSQYIPEITLLWKCQNVLATCISGVVLQECISTFLEWDFASPCTSRLLHFLLFNRSEYYPHPVRGPSGVYDWDLSLSTPTQPTHWLYTLAFSTASRNIACSAMLTLRIPHLHRWNILCPNLYKWHPVLSTPTQNSVGKIPFLTGSRGSMFCECLWCCSR